MKRLASRSIKLMILGLCGFLSSPAMVFARSPDSSSPPRRRLEQLIEELGLDEKTRTEVNKIIEASRAEHQGVRQQLDEARERMRSLLEQEHPDETAAMAQVDAIAALETKFHKQRLRTMLQVRALLTPEQRAKLLELWRARRLPGSRGARTFRERPCEVPAGPPHGDGP